MFSSFIKKAARGGLGIQTAARKKFKFFCQAFLLRKAAFPCIGGTPTR